jgi:aspartyl-tRNA(Asn)/glutamyl-tRNA(Gln) amidotransferase subunit A
LVQNELTSTLDNYDALVSPVAPTAALRVGEVVNDPLSMYKGDVMTVNLNLSGTILWY